FGSGMYDDPVEVGEVNGLAVARILDESAKQTGASVFVRPRAGRSSERNRRALSPSKHRPIHAVRTGPPSFMPTRWSGFTAATMDFLRVPPFYSLMRARVAVWIS